MHGNFTLLAVYPRGAWSKLIMKATDLTLTIHYQVCNFKN